MSSQHHNSAFSSASPDRAEGGELSNHVDSSAHLAHELANLLDGGLRNVGLVLGKLREATSHSHPDSAVTDDSIERLEVVNHALEQMGQLLKRWMNHRQSLQSLYHQGRSLRWVVDHALRLFAPAAQVHGIEIHALVSEEAAALPAGPIYPVVANALRNSIEAIHTRQDGVRGGRIDLTAQLDGADVVLGVGDDGPGLDPGLIDHQGRFRVGATTKPDGHGLGISLSQKVAAGLNGRIQIENRPPRGVQFTLRYPRHQAAELEG